MNMTRQVCIALAAVLTAVDAGLHLRRSLVPDGNPFGTPLHQQFFLYTVVAVLLVVGLLVAPARLGQRAWIASAMLMVWELGALGVWLIAYHAPNPPGLVPDEGYVSKFIEVLIVVVLLPTLRLPGAARQGQRTSGVPS
jgi:hypothetical protein